MAPLEALRPESRPPFIRRVSNALVLGALRGFWGVDVVGLELVPRTGAMIVAGNHVSNLDGFLLAVGLSGVRWPCFLGKAELFRVPVLGWFLRKCGSIPLERGRGDVAALRTAEDLLRRGWSLGMFPEGTRNKTGGRVSPKLGVAFLAARTGALVVPARIIGAARWPAPGRLEIRFGRPMAFAGEASDKGQVRAFAQAVMDRIFTL